MAIKLLEGSFASRKFLVTVMAIAMSFALCYLGKMSGGEFGLAIVGLTGAYTITNVMQKRNGKT
jgi:hypothetical protein